MENNADDLLDKVKKLYWKGEFEEILNLLTEDELKKHESGELYGWKARVYHRLDRDKGAKSLLVQQALDLDPNCFMGYFVMALIEFDEKEYDKAIEDYSTAIELNPNFADIYYSRGIVWQNKKENDKADIDYDKAILKYKNDFAFDLGSADAYNNMGYMYYFKASYSDAVENYSKAIEHNSNFAEAYYNRGLAFFAIKKYDKSIEDYTKAIELATSFKDVYYSDRGYAYRAIKNYDKAIEDYTEAIKINPHFVNAYYNRGLIKKEKNKDLEGSRQDFVEYLKFGTLQNDVWSKYAKDYIVELDAMIKDDVLSSIKRSVDSIKDLLLVTNSLIVHYTSLSALKSLVCDNRKFRISEGNFMNDPSEGKEFFKYLQYSNSSSCSKNSQRNFSPKPFIGSFVTENMRDNLNLWRFYGKEQNVAAKGCSITLCMSDFINNIEYSLLDEKKEACQDHEGDIKCYRVVYVVRDSSIKLYIPNLGRSKVVKLERIMDDLKKQVASYKGNNIKFLEKFLNSIAFLFKSDIYKNENEVRFVIQGVEFHKEYNLNIDSPSVYIELVPIKDIVKKIILGPKVDSVDAWIAALHYSYNYKPPTISVSRLSYK